MQNIIINFQMFHVVLQTKLMSEMYFLINFRFSKPLEFDWVQDAGYDRKDRV